MEQKRKVTMFLGVIMVVLLGVTILFNRQTTHAKVNEETSRRELVSHSVGQIEKETIMNEEAIEVNPTILAALEDTKKFGIDFWFSGQYSDTSYDDTYSLLIMSGAYLHGEAYIDETGERLNSDTDPDAATLGEIREAVTKYAEENGY